MYRIQRYNTYLSHHGILGQKWGKRNGPPYPLGASDHSSSEKKSGWRKSLKGNIKKSNVYYRVGKSSKDPNKSGVLYVSSSQEDSMRYIKNLGPSLLGKIMGNYGTHLQTLTPNSKLKMASDREVNRIVADTLKNNPEIVSTINNSIYSYLLKKEHIDETDIDFALNNLNSKEAQSLSYVYASILGNPDAKKEAKILYDNFRKNGFDAIPDLYDRMTGTSETASIVLNPDKLTIDELQMIDKSIYKNAKKFVKQIGNVKISDIYKNDLVAQ